MLWFDRHTRIRKKLSPYIDGQVSHDERIELEEHIAGCGSCSRELNELRATISAVGGLSDVEPPRSFALTPQMLEPRVSAPPPVPAYAAGMRLAGAAVAVVLAVVLIGDLGGSGGGMGGDGGDEGATSLDSAAESRTLELDAGGDGAPAATSAEQYSADLPDRPSGNDDAAAGKTESCPSSEDQSQGLEPAEDADARAAPVPGASPGVEAGSAGGAACGPAAAQAAPEENAIEAPGDNGEGEATTVTPAVAEDEGGGTSTLGVVEIVLAGSLLALLAGVVIEYAIRRRQAA